MSALMSVVMTSGLFSCGGRVAIEPQSGEASPWRDHLPHLSRDSMLWDTLSALKASSLAKSNVQTNERVERAPERESERERAQLGNEDLRSKISRTTRLSDDSARLLACLFGLAPSTDPRPRIASRDRLSPLTMSERARCDALLSRPTESERPTWLSHDWLIIDAHQTIDLGLAMANAQSAHYFKSERARWTLSVTLVRLPSRALNRPTGAPPPIKRWAHARVERAEVAQWSPTGVVRSPLDLSKVKRLEQLSSPRVGQALTLRLT